MYSVVFVVLHYLNLEDTIESVDNIINNINYNNYNIVIVDNGSRNGSGEKLSEHYKNNTNIYLIINQSNLGFAKGNNIGFAYAKQNLKCDFIILINNDINIKQRDFLEIVFEKYEQVKSAVIGPDIINIQNQRHQNPLEIKFTTSFEVKLYIIKLKLLLIINRIGLQFIIENIKNIKSNKVSNNIKFKEEKCGVPLHGSCLILTPIFVSKYDGLCDQTFMYMEEYILFNHLSSDRQVLQYCPELIVFHKDDASTNKAFDRISKKKFFYYKNAIISSKVLLKTINEVK